MHEQRYGTSAPDERAEIVSLRATVTGVMRKPPQAKIARGGRAPAKAAFTGKRPVYLGRQASGRRRPMRARRSPPATASPGRR